MRAGRSFVMRSGGAGQLCVSGCHRPQWPRRTVIQGPLQPVLSSSSAVASGASQRGLSEGAAADPGVGPVVGPGVDRVGPGVGSREGPGVVPGVGPDPGWVQG